MNRRGHLSSKIPNVKLRPAPAPTAGRRSTRRHPSPGREIPWDGEDADGDDDVEIPMDSASNKPWRGIVVTFTGVEDKPALSALVRELGGEVESALTVKVTHVVANAYGSPKYLYAIEHRIPVMAPSWIATAHETWIRGDELDVEGSITHFRLQPFIGLKIAVSGIDQLDRRKQIIRYIQASGGVYSKDLDRSCTHLISAFPTRDPKAKMSEKVKWALKEIGDREAARRRGRRIEGEDIKIVYEEWIWDCVAFGGRWKEEGYDARKPRAQGRVTYEQVLDGTAFLPPVKEKAADDNEDEEPVIVRKRKRDNIDNLVGELLSTTGKADKPEDVKEESRDLVDTTMEAEDSKATPPAEVLPSRGDMFERKPSVLHTSRLNAFASAPGPTRPSLPSTSTDTSTDPTDSNKRPRTASFFSGLRISHAIAEGYEGLENALQTHGAALVTETERLGGMHVDYVVVRLSSKTKPPMPETDNPPQLVTECWVEACCFRQKLVDPDENIVFRPLDVEKPIPGAEGLMVHISGFSTETRAFLGRLLKALGGTKSEKFNRHTSHLLCAEPTGIKYEKALEWGVPVVRDSWLWTMGRTGRVEPVEDHAMEAVGATERPTAPAAPLTSSTNANLTSASNLVDNSSSAANPSSLAAQPSSLPSSRMLKAAPTHVEAANMNVSLDLSALSPPSVAAERRLNLARGSPAHASHPTSSPRNPGSELKAAATVAAAGGTHGKDEVTAALRRLAEGGGVTSAKVVRRSRPSSGRRETSGSSKTEGFPSAVLPDAGTGSRPVSPPPEPVTSPGPGARVVGIEDESIRVTYADHAGEKERRRMLDAVLRGTTGAAATGANGRGSASPRKRRAL